MMTMMKHISSETNRGQIAATMQPDFADNRPIITGTRIVAQFPLSPTLRRVYDSVHDSTQHVRTVGLCAQYGEYAVVEI